MKRGFSCISIILSISILCCLQLTSAFLISVPFTTDCSDAAIKAMWDSIFKETSLGITIFTNATLNQGDCSQYFAYKIKDDLAFIMEGKSSGTTPEDIIIKAVKGNYTQVYLSQLLAITHIKNTSGIIGNTANTKLRPTPLTSTTQADNEFNTTFKSALVFWQQVPDFQFNTNENSSILLTNVSTALLVSSAYDGLDIKKTKLSSTCTSSWQSINGSCQADETFTTWSQDANGCGNITPPNITNYCDYNTNGVIGSFDTLRTANINFFVENVSANDSATYAYTGYRPMIVRLGSIDKVMLTYDFTTPLNIKNFSLEKQSSGATKGYLLVKGLEVQKTIYVDKINPTSNKICAKDAGITSITQMSDYCNDTAEYIVYCPGSNGTISCAMDNFTFTISGLAHSAASEFTQSQGNSNCQESWTCTEWNACSGNLETRSCLDINNCGTNATRPFEQQACQSCTTNWTCTAWNACPQNSTQTRTCTDTNACGVLLGKLPEVQSCTQESSSGRILALIFVIFLAIVAGIIGIIYYFKQQREELTRPYSLPDTKYTYQ